MLTAVGLDAPATFPCSGKTDTVVLGSVRPQDAEREYHAPGGHYRVAQGGKVHPQPVAQVSGLYMAAPDVEDVYFAFAGGQQAIHFVIECVEVGSSGWELQRVVSVSDERVIGERA